MKILKYFILILVWIVETNADPCTDFFTPTRLYTVSINSHFKIRIIQDFNNQLVSTEFRSGPSLNFDINYWKDITLEEPLHLEYDTPPLEFLRNLTNSFGKNATIICYTYFFEIATQNHLK